MEIELGAPLFRAVVTKVLVTHYHVKLHVRYHRKSVLDEKRREFSMLINRNGCEARRFRKARRLKAGDELFVDPYGEDWTGPKHFCFLRRMWNLTFA